jgi:hypothetical protein
MDSFDAEARWCHEGRSGFAAPAEEAECNAISVTGELDSAFARAEHNQSLFNSFTRSTPETPDRPVNNDRTECERATFPPSLHRTFRSLSHSDRVSSTLVSERL